MRVLLVSQTGLTLGLAMRIENDGHDVRFATLSTAGRGLIRFPAVDESWVPDIALYDNLAHTTEAENVRSHGFKVLGPTRWSSMLESDENYRKQIITSLGWSTTPLAQGTHMYISAWFNGASFIASYASIVYRRFMPGGAGPDLMCTGMIGNFKGLTPKTYHTFVEPLERVLKKVNHRGGIHLHTMVDGDNFCVKEIHASFAHPLSLLLYENTNLSVSDVILRLFDETSKPIQATDKWACGVQISTPPYPYERGNREPAPITGIVPGNLKHLWLADVSRTDGAYSVDGSGLVGYVTARGNDENECVRRMYRTVGNLKSPDLQYRNDIGRNAQSILNALRQPDWLD